MTYKYDKPNSCLVQQPGEDAPKGPTDMPSIDEFAYAASLLTLPLLSIPEGWVDGQVVTSEQIEIKETVWKRLPDGEEKLVPLYQYAIPILPAQEGKEVKGEEIKFYIDEVNALVKQYNKKEISISKLTELLNDKLKK